MSETATTQETRVEFAEPNMEQLYRSLHVVCREEKNIPARSRALEYVIEFAFHVGIVDYGEFKALCKWSQTPLASALRSMIAW